MITHSLITNSFAKLSTAIVKKMYNEHKILKIKSVCVLITENCRTALGMESQEIPDSALTASSMYGDAVSPRSARYV